jgi:nucleotide-binding universal stress UspA family protein
LLRWLLLDSGPATHAGFLANGRLHRRVRLLRIDVVSADAIISYDGTANDDDALALGKLLALNGTGLELAYVRHAPEFDPHRESLAQHDAERRLELGAERLGDPEIPRHVVFGRSTGATLQELAESEEASMIVFGSDYRTPPGHAEPSTSAQQLLETGRVAIAVAAAGLRAKPSSTIASIAVLPGEDDGAAKETAVALASRLGAEVVSADGADADLIVVGSQREAPGRIALSGHARSVLDSSRGSVLVVPSGKPVPF